MQIYITLYTFTLFNHTTCYAISQSITPKISSRWLINKHEQFNLNYSTKHIISQKYFMNTIHVNSKTFGYCSRPITKHRFHFVNPNFITISGFIHITIQFVSQIIQSTTQTAPHGHGLHKFGSTISHTSVPSFGTNQTAVQGLEPTETS